MTADDEVRAHFGSLAHEYDAQTEWRRHPAVLCAMSELTRRIDGVALDLGTGTGLVGARVACQVGTLIGVDFSAEMLGIAKRRIRNVILADVTKLPLQRNSIACCLMRQLLHYTHPPSVLQEITRILPSGGTMILAHVTSATYADLDWWRDVKRIVQPLRRNVFSPEFHRDCMTAIGGIIEEERELDLWRSDPLHVFKRHVLPGAADERELADLLAEAPHSVCLDISGQHIRYLQHWMVSRGRLG